jgi:hypothetical protein
LSAAARARPCPGPSKGALCYPATMANSGFIVLVEDCEHGRLHDLVDSQIALLLR